MSKLLDRARELLAAKKSQIRDRQFLDAAMAATALVADADGEVTLAELLSRDEILSRVEALQAFDSNAAVEIFRSYVAAIDADRKLGTEAALVAVGRFGKDPEIAQLLLRAAVAVAKADSEFSDEEKRVVAQLCEALGVEAIALDGD